jgi:hypothetical protein
MRIKFSVFSTYALLSLIGFGGFWWMTAKGGEAVSATNAFLAFYGFLSTTVTFYVLASQKQSMDIINEVISNETNERNREIEAAYRYIDNENEKIARRIDNEVTSVYREFERERNSHFKNEECCKAL